MLSAIYSSGHLIHDRRELATLVLCSIVGPGMLAWQQYRSTFRQKTSAARFCMIMSALLPIISLATSCVGPFGILIANIAHFLVFEHDSRVVEGAIPILVLLAFVCDITWFVLNAQWWQSLKARDAAADAEIGQAFTIVDAIALFAGILVALAFAIQRVQLQVS
ncbi:hypothetical protein [Bremerella cremea]|uniref:hypothetical protein n=1 Tax=Bremerella cremea TaxID=1031537 RepID=UPI0031EC6D52